MIRNLVQYIRIHGLRTFFRRLSLGILSVFYINRTVCIFSITGAEQLQLDNHVTVLELRREDVDIMRKVMYSSAENIESRFVRGDRCFAVMEAKEISSFFWVMVTDRHIPELDLLFRLKDGYAWMYNAVTIPQDRGRGLYPIIVNYIVSTLNGEGIERFLIDVEKSNCSSVRGLIKAGCRKIVEIQRVKLFSKKKYFLHIFDVVVWEKLFVGVEGRERINWVGGT